ncbi:MAG: hypothetical protein EOP85_15100 [Verrucomicrobiaceae bacterium]|nr:MAG: hypothetical protein EOP85_15100 [Verrucomicrobiaceae bacterium]
MIHLDSPQAVQDHLADIAPNLRGVDAVLEHELGWTIGFEDDTALLLEWAESPTRIVLTGEIGRPPEAREAELLRSLLAYNLQWEASGGVRAAMGGEEGELVLIYEWHAELFEPASLAGVIEDLAEATRWWSRAVAFGEGAGESPSPVRAPTMRSSIASELTLPALHNRACIRWHLFRKLCVRKQPWSHIWKISITKSNRLTRPAISCTRSIRSSMKKVRTH